LKVEEHAIVLDFLPRGKSTGYKSEPLAQVIGIEYFTLLEVVPKADVSLKAGEKVYVGKEEREKIDYIKRRIAFKDLTSNSVSEIEKTIEKIVCEDEKKYVEFFNNARSLTLKRHQLELLPGLGKKHMLNAIEERRKKSFESFKDIEERVKLMPQVVRTIVKRIMEELEGEDDTRHYLFVRPPAPEKPRFQQNFRR
jgi:putative nucleotide binding protein